MRAVRRRRATGLHALKYAGERRIAEPLGEAVARRWRVAGAGGDVLVPVPVHEGRRRQRGYDQAALIAEVAARELRLPVVEAVVRAHATEAQYRLDGDIARPTCGMRSRSRAGRRRIGRRAAGSSSSTTSSRPARRCRAGADALLDAGAAAVSAVTVARER